MELEKDCECPRLEFVEGWKVGSSSRDLLATSGEASVEVVWEGEAYEALVAAMAEEEIRLAVVAAIVDA